MDNVQKHDNAGSGLPGESNRYVVDVVRGAEQKLRHLIEERAEISKRIGTVKRTIVGLAKLFGNSVLDTVPLELVDPRRGPRRRQPGITWACRRVLMEAQRPMGARDVCDEIQRTATPLLARHKNPRATINTILARLVEYGEATVSPGDHGQTTWSWVAESDRGLKHIPDNNGRGSIA